MLVRFVDNDYAVLGQLSIILGKCEKRACERISEMFGPM